MARPRRPVVGWVGVAAPTADGCRVGLVVSPLQRACPGGTPASQHLLVKPGAADAAESIRAVEAAPSPAPEGIGSSRAPAAKGVEGQGDQRDRLEPGSGGRVERWVVVCVLALLSGAKPRPSKSI